MKTCSKCLETKSKTEFYKQVKNSRDGFQSHCKKCDNLRTKAWKLAHPESVKAYVVRSEANRAHNEARKAYRAKARKLPHNKVSRNAAYAKRRAAKLNRTPKWLTEHDLTVMKAFYAVAQMLTRVNGEPWHVDHDIPLQANLASGLHVPSNLRLMRGIENETKRNQYYIE